MVLMLLNFRVYIAVELAFGYFVGFAHLCLLVNVFKNTVVISYYKTENHSKQEIITELFNKFSLITESEGSLPRSPATGPHFGLRSHRIVCILKIL
jgi:hypothetical protein